MLTCNRMRSLVLTSAISLLVGILLEALVQIVSFTTPTVVPAVLSAIAAFGVLFAAILLAAIFLANLLPATANRMSNCQH